MAPRGYGAGTLEKRGVCGIAYFSLLVEWGYVVPEDDCDCEECREAADCDEECGDGADGCSGKVAAGVCGGVLAGACLGGVGGISAVGG